MPVVGAFETLGFSPFCSGEAWAGGAVPWLWVDGGTFLALAFAVALALVLALVEARFFAPPLALLVDREPAGPLDTRAGFFGAGLAFDVASSPGSARPSLIASR